MDAQVTAIASTEFSTDEKQSVSPEETHTIYTNDNTAVVARVPAFNQGDQLHLDIEVTVKQNNPVYREEYWPEYKPASLPERPPKKPFWRRHSLWLLTIFILVVTFVAVLVGITRPDRSTAQTSHTIPNNTLHSVASSGMFLNDETTWNMQMFWQTTTGGINFQMSLDGTTFEPSQKVALNIEPKVGSPLAATAEVDPETSVVMLNLFYISRKNNISMASITCAANSVDCNTISNSYLPTMVAVNENTGLAAVNVGNPQDLRVYYYDEEGYVSEMAGNSSGFNFGTAIGGLALNSSDIAAVNINSTTNEINLFYVDQLTEALFTMEFTSAWTTPTTVSPQRVTSWNPTSGLGAAYSPGQDQLHIYYTGLDQGIYEFLANSVSFSNRTWLAQPGRNHIWAMADYVGADITAVGWLDQVRFFQIAQNKMVQGSLSNMTWTEAFVGPVSL